MAKVRGQVERRPSQVRLLLTWQFTNKLWLISFPISTKVWRRVCVFKVLKRFLRYLCSWCWSASLPLSWTWEASESPTDLHFWHIVGTVPLAPAPPSMSAQKTQREAIITASFPEKSLKRSLQHLCLYMRKIVCLSQVDFLSLIISAFLRSFSRTNTQSSNLSCRDCCLRCERQKQPQKSPERGRCNQ